MSSYIVFVTDPRDNTQMIDAHPVGLGLHLRGAVVRPKR